MVKESNTFETEWTTWTPFIQNTQNELNELEKIGATAFLEISMLNIFYSRLTLFLSTRWSYVSNKEEKKTKLRAIGKTLFSREYLNDIKKAKEQPYYNNPALVNIQNILLNGLLDILEEVCQDFSDRRLLYNVEEKEELIGAQRTSGK